MSNLPHVIRSLAKLASLTASFTLAVALVAQTAHAHNSQGNQNNQGNQDDQGNRNKNRRKDSSSAEPAQLNTFGCEGVGGATFAGRYLSIAVFADAAALTARRPNTEALVFGTLLPNPLPTALSSALVYWTLSLETSDNTLLLHGIAVRPDGVQLLVRLRVPRTAGVYESVIRTDDVAAGTGSQETIICTIR